MGIFDIFKSKGDTKKTLSNKKAKANQYYAKGMELVDLANNSKNEDEENKYEQRAYNYFARLWMLATLTPFPNWLISSSIRLACRKTRKWWRACCKMQ